MKIQTVVIDTKPWVQIARTAADLDVIGNSLRSTQSWMPLLTMLVHSASGMHIPTATGQSQHEQWLRKIQAQPVSNLNDSQFLNQVLNSIHYLLLPAQAIEVVMLGQELTERTPQDFQLILADCDKTLMLPIGPGLRAVAEMVTRHLSKTKTPLTPPPAKQEGLWDEGTPEHLRQIHQRLDAMEVNQHKLNARMDMIMEALRSLKLIPQAQESAA